MHEADQRRRRDGDDAEHEGPLGRQRGGGDHHRRQQQDRERVLKPAGKVKQHRKLHDIEGEQGRRRAGLEPVAERKADAQRDVQPGRDGDRREAPAEGQRIAQPEMHACHGEALPGDGEPAQAHQRVETQVTIHAAEGECRYVRRGHDCV
jgi:hypothetical protein